MTMGQSSVMHSPRNTILWSQPRSQPWPELNHELSRGDQGPTPLGGTHVSSRFQGQTAALTALGAERLPG